MVLKKYSAFDHAAHNLEAHKLLKKNGGFSDWEVTTAFYTCLKFFQGALFPADYKHPSTQKIAEFETFNDYRALYNRFIGGTPHKAIKHFVKNNTPEDIWLSYKELYDVCHDSRYKNYIINSDDLKIAQEALESIKQYCISNQK